MSSATGIALPAAPARGLGRRALDGLYEASMALAALAMIGLLLMVLLSVLGRQVGWNVPGIDAHAGYLMAACGFLALAGTLKRGEHIRVTLLLGTLSGTPRRAFEIGSLGLAALLAALSAFYAGRLVWQSWLFNDISTGNDATPLWIPQLAMVVGTVVLAIAFIDEFILECRGLRAVPQSGEASHNE